MTKSIEDITNVKEITNIEEMNVKKLAWINDTEEVISFHESPRTTLYEAEEDVFWKYIKSLVSAGYKLQ